MEPVLFEAIGTVEHFPLIVDHCCLSAFLAQYGLEESLVVPNHSMIAEAALFTSMVLGCKLRSRSPDGFRQDQADPPSAGNCISIKQLRNALGHKGMLTSLKLA